MSRNLLLPRRRSYDRLDLQRGALEALIETKHGPIRFYSVHLDHRDPGERGEQNRFLLERLLNYALEGGALSGLAEMGFPEPPHPAAYVAMGDFNMLQDSVEYYELAARPDHESGIPLTAKRAVDAAARLCGDGGAPTTWVDLDHPQDMTLHKRIDYVFISPDLVPLLKASHVDQKAVGSDHQPLWVEFG